MEPWNRHHGTVELQALEIAECEQTIVQSSKALGLIIQSNLKWDEHIRCIVAKASECLHVLRILRQCGTPTS